MYVTSTYRDRTTYLKGLHLNLDSGIPCIDKEGRGLRREEFNMSKLDGKWEGTEEVNKPKLVIEVPCLRVDLIACGRLYCSWFQVECTSTWNSHTPSTHGNAKTETYPRIASGRQHGGLKITT